VDLVEEQLRIAAGEAMRLGNTPPRRGHAVECRIYAEDPRTFLPSPGTIGRLQLPGADVRSDFGYDSGDDVPMFYDPLIGKVIAFGTDRSDAIEGMRSALDGLRVDGIKTNRSALIEVLDKEAFRSGNYNTGLLGK